MRHAAHPNRIHKEHSKTSERSQVISSRVRTKEQDDHGQHAKKTKRAEEEIQVKKKAYVKRIEALKNTKADIQLALRKVEHITACMQRDGRTELSGESPQEVLRMVDAAPRPEMVLLDPADVDGNEQRLDEELHKDAEDSITHGYSGVDAIDGIASAVHPEYPYVFGTAASEWKSRSIF